MAKIHLNSLEEYLATVKKWLDNHDEDLSWDELKSCYSDLVINCSTTHQLHFATSFSRLSFLIDSYNIPKAMAWQCHHLRILFKTKKAHSITADQLKKAKMLIRNLIDFICHDSPSYPLDQLFKRERRGATKQGEKLDFVKALVLEDKEEGLSLLINHKSQERYLLKSASWNDYVAETIEIIKKQKLLPCEVNLEDVKIYDDGTLSAGFIILQPNYLIDVSAIANCVDINSYDKEKYIVNKLLPKPSNTAILLGNLVNLLFDELTFDPELQLRDFLSRIFKEHPLALSLFSDQELQQFIHRLKYHYHVLTGNYRRQAAEEGLESKYCYVEPSFISPEYGIQGRLDALFIHPNPVVANKIIELKSGKVFRPNKYGLNSNHYAQTILYELLTKKALSRYKNKTANYILYSREEGVPLRYAPSTRNMFRDLLQLRNYMMAFEYQNLTPKGWISTLRLLYGQDKLRVKGFMADNYRMIKETFKGMRAYEKDYFLEQLAFLSREQMVQKIGKSDRRAGQSQIWLADMDDKQQRFAILNHMVIKELQAEAEPPIIRLIKTSKSAKISSFRIGDIVLLYPLVEKQGISSSQVFRATIIEIVSDEVVLKLKAKQRNPLAFKVKYWNIEPDYMDNSIQRNMSNMTLLFNLTIDQRDLLLQPQNYLKQADNSLKKVDFPFTGTREQIDILHRYIQSKKLFILWGPPGTGKTSIMLKQIVQYYYEHSEENLLLAGYTNRSVDEICEAVLASVPEDQILRIGSHHSTGQKYRHLLLQEKVNEWSDRKKLRSGLAQARVVVGTIHSLSGKKDLFRLKKFNRLIVDEASQILETQIMSLYPLVKHIALIGDHHQLPAVVSQESQDAEVRSKTLQNLGYQHWGESLFGRLFRQLKEAKLDEHYAMLSYQGRMHEDINRVVSGMFYKDELQILPEGIAHRAVQLKPLKRSEKEPIDKLSKALNTERLIFIDSQESEGFILAKSSYTEAQIVKTTLERLQELIPNFDADEVGIITPFKAQIAAIRQLTGDNAVFNSIKTDTVERYQGGAKNTIIISLTVCSEISLKSIVNANQEGIDRKLNVALSRAREQVIVVGNKSILSTNEQYAKLIKESHLLKYDALKNNYK